MTRYTLDRILEHLKQELDLTTVKAEEIKNRFEALCRETESMKVDVLQNCVEEQKKSVARNIGMSYLIKDKKRVRDSLLVAAGSFVFGGLLTRDKFGALVAGMSGFDGVIQGFGESKWCVLLGKNISVVPEEKIPLKVPYIPLASFYKTMENLKKRALAGGKLENLDAVIAKIKREAELKNQQRCISGQESIHSL